MTRPISSFRRHAALDWRESPVRPSVRDRRLSASQVEELVRIGSDALALAVQAFRQAAAGSRDPGAGQEMLRDLSSALVQLVGMEGQREGPGRERQVATAVAPPPRPPLQPVPLPRAAMEQAVIDHVGRTLNLGKGASHLLLCLLEEPGVFHELSELSRLLSPRATSYNVLRVYACRLRRALERHGLGDAIVTGACSYMLKSDRAPAVRALLG